MTDTPEKKSYVRGNCPHCQAPWRAAASAVGRQARCRQCGKVFPVEAAAPDENAPSVPESATAQPEQIPGYETDGELGHGGMGMVYRARELSTKRTVALKVMLAGRLATKHQRRRFEREVEIAASLEHANIARLYASGLYEGHYWFAMQYVEGESLDRFVAGRKLDARAVVGLFVPICEAVNHAHQRGIMHRDLKPGNILVDGQSRPYVLDFGLAKPADADVGAEVSIEGQIAGTPAYMSPEQTTGNPSTVDVRTDVYSLGVILYRLLTGHSPYGDDKTSLAGLFRAINESDPPPPHRLRKGIPDEISAIVLKALEKDPARRYQSAGEMGRDLRAYLSGEPVSAKQGSGLYVLRKLAVRHRGLAGAVAAVVVLSLGLGTVMSALFAKTRVEVRQVVRKVEVLRREVVRMGGDPNQALAEAGLGTPQAARGPVTTTAPAAAAATMPGGKKPVQPKASPSPRWIELGFDNKFGWDHGPYSVFPDRHDLSKGGLDYTVKGDVSIVTIISEPGTISLKRGGKEIWSRTFDHVPVVNHGMFVVLSVKRGDVIWVETTFISNIHEGVVSPPGAPKRIGVVRRCSGHFCFVALAGTYENMTLEKCVNALLWRNQGVGLPGMDPVTDAEIKGLFGPEARIGENPKYFSVYVNPDGVETIVAPSGPIPAHVRVLRAVAKPGGDGRSWASAYADLQQALAASRPGQEIWVATGTYKPDRGTGDRAATFGLKSGVALYGGFIGTESRRVLRDPRRHETILTGDLKGDDAPDFANRKDNSLHVVTAIKVDRTTVLDGFTIAGGNADERVNTATHGGGFSSDGGAPLVASCIFTGNMAVCGGGAHVARSSGVFRDCIFWNNAAFGLAIEPRGPGSTGNGAGMVVDEGSPVLINCQFIQNTATNEAGGVSVWPPCGAKPRFYNCVFNRNRAGSLGGAMRNWGLPQLFNCTFVANSAKEGSAVFCFGRSNSGNTGNTLDCTAELWNCLVWDSPDGARATRLRGPVIVRNSCVQGLAADVQGSASLSKDPMFVDPNGPDGKAGTADDDLRLRPGSPCIDAGDNAALPKDSEDLDGDGDKDEPIPLDLAGRPRVVGGKVDIGAYEYQRPAPAPPASAPATRPGV